MKKIANKKVFLFWGMGIALFALRLYQNLRDFDSATGLHTLSPAGIALIVLTVAAGAAALVLSLGASREKPDLMAHFLWAKQYDLPYALGCLLLIFGGVVMAAGSVYTDFMLQVSNAPAVAYARIAAGLLAVLSGLSLLLFRRCLAEGIMDSIVALLPPMFFAALWVLSLYLPAANDPVLARYAFPILAAALAAYAFAQLAGFSRRETKPGMFDFVSGWAVALCIGAIAEWNMSSLLFAGCAMLLSAFLLMARQEK